MNRNQYLSRIALGIALAVAGTNLMAQPGAGMKHRGGPDNDQHAFCMAIPGLTDEQEQKLDRLRTAHLKEMTALRNDIAVKRAEIQKLETVDKPDMAQINKTIDELGSVRTEMAKKRAAHLQQVRSLLTEEQRVYFDALHYGRGNGYEGRHREFGHGYGMGPDCPMQK